MRTNLHTHTHTHTHTQRTDKKSHSPALHLRRVHGAAGANRLELPHQAEHLVLLVQVRQLPAVRLGTHLLNARGRNGVCGQTAGVRQAMIDR